MIYRCHHALARRRQLRTPGSLLESTGGSVLESAEEHDVDFSAAGGLPQFLASFSLGRIGTDLTDVHGDRPAAPGGILPHGPALHRKGLLVPDRYKLLKILRRAKMQTRHHWPMG